MEIIYSKHAKEQREERKIQCVWIEEAIKYPDETKRIENKHIIVKKLNGKTLKIIYVKQKYIKVITLFWL